MTKEQEKAIETMKHWIDFEKHNRDKINKADDLIKIQETVLNMLKERDKEIENNKKKNKELSNQILKLYKEQDNYNARIEKKNTEIAKKDNELKKKDKIIDLMAERIEWLCKSNGILLDKEHDENFKQQDIKQYFEQKATKTVKSDILS